jgi:hypothetical protein
MGSKFFDLGLRLDDLETARIRIENLLGIEMKGCDSHAYGCICYFYKSHDIDDLMLFRNWNTVDGEWNRPNYDFDLLVEIDRKSDSEAIENKIIGDPMLGAEILKAEEFSVNPSTSIFKGVKSSD